MQMPADPKSPEMRRRRFRPIPVRMLVPNVITLLAICAGLPAIREVVFTSTLDPGDLEDALHRALQTVNSDAGLRRRVASCARERWRADWAHCCNITIRNASS